jgi:diguanylate cyclase (GGDEF)-like protein
MFLATSILPDLPTDIPAAHTLIRELRAKVTRLEALALLDPLTAIANRRAFDERLAAAFAHALRTSTPLAVAVLDVDNFKLRNDTQGHAAGDRCLKAIAAQLVFHTRGEDVAARIGGEEFALVLPNTTSEQALALVNRIADTIRCCYYVGPPLTFSAGVAQLDATMAHPCTITERADRAMYDAKESGKNRAFIYKSQPTRSVFSWMKLK